MIFPENYNMSHCFTDTDLTQPECVQFFEKMFKDLKCMMDVKRLHQNQNDSAFRCHCPPPCKSVNYETFYSTSKFPGSSLELNSAYRKIVQERVVPYYERFNTSLSREMVKYFSDSKNRDSILQNFARFTIYIKDLTVQTSEQVPAYSELDLLSDIGMYCQVPLKFGLLILSLFKNWDKSQTYMQLLLNPYPISRRPEFSIKSCQDITRSGISLYDLRQ